MIYTIPPFSPLVKITDGTCILFKHNRLIQQVKTSYPPISRVCLFLGLLLILLGQVAEAQVGWSDEPVFPMTPTIMSAGRWYITGGAKLRQGQRVSFDKTPTSGGYTVPFGPTLPGSFGPGGVGTPQYPQLPTGNASDSPDNSGVWIYDNGVLNPANPNINGTFNSSTPQQNLPVFQTFSWTVGTAPNQQTVTSTVETNPGDSAWTALTYPTMGTQVYQWINPNPYVPAADKYNWSYFNSGSFFVKNKTQFSPSTSFGAAKSVSYDLTLNTNNQLKQPPTLAPTPPSVGDDGFTSQSFDNWIWSPYVEIGFWSESFISIYYSFSAFRFSNSFGKNISATLYPYATSLTDSYTFSSIGFESDGTQAVSNPALIFPNFTSIKSQNSTSVLYSYSLDPLSGYRVFRDANNNVIDFKDILNVTENLSVSLIANCYENKLAVLSMVPVLPSLHLGVSLGPVATMVHFTINYENIVLNPKNSAEVLLMNTGRQVDNQWSFGGFASVDLRMNLLSTFLGCSFDYAYMTDVRYSLVDIQTFINPGGRSLNFFWGLKF